MKNTKNKTTRKPAKKPHFQFLKKSSQIAYERGLRQILDGELSKALSKTEDNVSAFAIQRMRDRCLKKLKSNHTLQLADRAMADFVEFNRTATEPDVDRVVNYCGWSCSDPYNEYLQMVLDYAQQFIYETLESFTRTHSQSGVRQDVLDFNLLAERVQFGPKASIGWDSSVPAVNKLQQLTGTSRAARYLGILLEGFPSVDGELKEIALSTFLVVVGGKLGAVPKSDVEARVIMTEPSLNGGLQLSAGNYIRDALSMIGLCIKGDGNLAANRNKQLAQIASRYYESGLYATLDLRRASDSIMRSLVRRLFPQAWVELLEDLRSPYVEVKYSFDKKATLEPLNVFCTMGNGFTFPLQTLIFTSLAVALRAVAFGVPLEYRLTAKHDPMGKLKVSVFGDDIIVPKVLATQMVDLLEYCGFKTNLDKSYLEGPFYESCGGDYYEGHDVTPKYIRNVKTRAGLAVAFNSLVSWSTFHQVDLSQTLYYIGRRLYGQRCFNIVPSYHGPDEGILYPSSRPRARQYNLFSVVPRKHTTEAGLLGWPFGMYHALSGSFTSDIGGGEAIRPYVPLVGPPSPFEIEESDEEAFRNQKVTWSLSKDPDREPHYHMCTVPSTVCWFGKTMDGHIFGRLGNSQRVNILQTVERTLFALEYRMRVNLS